MSSQEGQTCCHIARTQARGDSADDGFRGGSGGSDTSPTGMHDSSEKRTGPYQQEGMRSLGPGRRGHGFRVNTTRQPRHETRDAPAVIFPLLYMGAGNVPSVQSKGAQEGYRRSHSALPRSSTPARDRTRRPSPTFRRYTTHRSPAPHLNRSTGHGVPGAGACLRLHVTRRANVLPHCEDTS